MQRRLARALHPHLRQPPQILPQRLPLLLKLPHLPPLEQRHNESLRQVEQLEGRAHGGLHDLTLPPRR